MYSPQPNQAYLHLSLGSSNYPQTTTYCMGSVGVLYWTSSCCKYIVILRDYSERGSNYYWCTTKLTCVHHRVGTELGKLYAVKYTVRCYASLDKTYRKQINFLFLIMMEYLWISLHFIWNWCMLLMLGRQLYFGKGEYIGVSPLIDYPILFLCRHRLLTEIHVMELPSQQ